MRVENETDEGVVLEGDEELLRVVYGNLIGNACKYGREGGVIRLRTKNQGTIWRMEVWNDGPGVPREKMDRLLGLFISRTIVELHGGKIWAEGVEGEWIHFVIELPKSQEGRRYHESEKDLDHR